MASSSSSSSSRIWRRFHVFPSFHGPDVRRGFLSHLHNHFESKGIMTFKDHEIERGDTIKPELVKAIRESRVSIVVLSKNYASSSWCLDELVEIMKCKEASGKIVMTIFYDVDPSDVRKQKGDFGSAFEKTCQGKTEEMKQKWIEALAHVATIAGEHSLNWPNEAEMIKQICKNVSKKLYSTLWKDFPGMVGLEAHLTKLESMLCLECDEVKMIGICGPPRIGKATIARVLFKQLSADFPLGCFMGNLKGIMGSDDDYKLSKLRLRDQLLSKILNQRIMGNLKGIMGIDDDDYESSKLRLQNQFLSKILNQKDMRVHHLDATKEWLQDQRVLIILDDVNDVEQLKVLARELSWFGSGSRIIVITEDKMILKAHGINDIYHVESPSEKEALEILCKSAFNQSSPRVGFEKLAMKVAKVCIHLPLSLCVVGSSLRGVSKFMWKRQLSSMIETTVLRVGYDRLSNQNQSLFLHIACFFNNEVIGHVKSILSDSNRLTDSDVRKGLKTPADKSLVHVSDGRIAMHHLLEQLGRHIVRTQSNEPGKRQFLEDAKEIHNVLANKKGTGSVIGISFYVSKIGKFSISEGAFERMCNLQFLRISSVKATTLGIPENKFPPHLRLLDWDAYPRKQLPPTFQPEHLVELHMKRNNLGELWRGIKPLPNLKKINLGFSFKLKEIPDLSHATNLETLTLTCCTSLVELSTSISNLHKLKKLKMKGCRKLKVIPTNINLASLEEVDMSYCSRLKSFPDISSNIKTLSVRDTKIKDIRKSIVECWSRLECFDIGNRRLKSLTHIPECVTSLDLRNSRIKSIPDCVIGLPHLVDLIVKNCTKLVSIPALPSSLKFLNANDCVSLKRVRCSFHNKIKLLTFYNCVKLYEEARRKITQQSIHDYICLPGNEIPTEFTHQAIGRSITISSGTFSASSRFKACLLLWTIKADEVLPISCCLRSKEGVMINSICSSVRLSNVSPRSEHLFIFRQGNICCEVATSEIIFEFSGCYNDDKIIECGVQILTEDDEGGSNNNAVDNFETESSISEVDNSETESSESEEDNLEADSSSSDEDNLEAESSSVRDTLKAKIYDFKCETLSWIESWGH